MNQKRCLVRARLPPGAVLGTWLPKPFIIEVSHAMSLPKSASGFFQFKLWLLVVYRRPPKLGCIVICLRAVYSEARNAGATEADNIDEVAAPALYI